MPAHKQISHQAETLTHVELPLRLISAIGAGAMAVYASAVGAVAQERQQPAAKVCIEQACGATALSKMGGSDLLPHTQMPSSRFVADNDRKPDASTKPKPTKSSELPTPKPTSTALPQLHPRLIHRDVHMAGKGFDFSWPQCGRAEKYYKHSELFPGSANFAMVGLNEGRIPGLNPCFGKELSIAQKIAGKNVMLYVMAANLKGVKGVDWPKNNSSVKGSGLKNPYGSCPQSKLACDWIAGRQLADKDLGFIEKAPVKAALQSLLWIDVETGMDWDSKASNLAVVRGMNAELEHKRWQTGVYTASGMWNKIIGRSNLPELAGPEWLAPGGPEACDLSPVVKNAHVLYGQNTPNYPKGSHYTLDLDYAC